ncbi:MAG: tRNA pseudouridine(38-40) synthase TruA [Treponema sp.]|nr:tRNA pseudouridine(38-40) synthase TruA [Treponema sp.]
MKRNIKLTIAYDGTDFNGWQRQEHKKKIERTVQGDIEKALNKIHGKQINLTGSGRTDSGVHAVGQIANFYTDIESIPAERFTQAINSYLTHDVRVLNSCLVDDDFHARFSAKSRFYRYQFICNSSGYTSALPHENRYNLHLYRTPRLDLLNAYGRLLLGETECAFFACVKDSSILAGKSSKRYIYKAYFYFEKDKLIFEIRANAFLRNMVRSIAGTFLHYEETGTPPRKLREIIASGKRSLAGTTLPAHGLFLWQVEY